MTFPGRICGTAPGADVPLPTWPHQRVPQADAATRFHQYATK